MPKTCENWPGLVNSHFYYACQTHGIYQLHVLPYSVDFKAPGGIWNQLSKTVLSKCSFIWNTESVKILNNHKAKSNLYVHLTCKYFS